MISIRAIGLHDTMQIYPSKGLFNCCICDKKGFYLFYPEVCNSCIKERYG